MCADLQPGGRQLLLVDDTMHLRYCLHRERVERSLHDQEGVARRSMRHQYWQLAADEGAAYVCIHLRVDQVQQCELVR